MNQDISQYKKEIIELENALLKAFEEKDLKSLEEIIHEDALFVLPNGLQVTKAKVLQSYRSGDTRMTSIIADDQVINFIGDNAIVSMNLEMKGNYNNQIVSARFRYIRVWKLINEQWKVIATSGVPMGN